MKDHRELDDEPKLWIMMPTVSLIDPCLSLSILHVSLMENHLLHSDFTFADINLLMQEGGYLALIVWTFTSLLMSGPGSVVQTG